MFLDPADPAIRQRELDRLIESIWNSVLDEMLQTHEQSRSAYRFSLVFLEQLGKREGFLISSVEGPEMTHFERRITPFLDNVELTYEERGHILASLLELTTAFIVRAHKRTP